MEIKTNKGREKERKKKGKKASAVNGEYQVGSDTSLKYTKKMGQRFPDES